MYMWVRRCMCTCGLESVQDTCRMMLRHILTERDIGTLLAGTNKTLCSKAL